VAENSKKDPKGFIFLGFDNAQIIGKILRVWEKATHFNQLQ